MRSSAWLNVCVTVLALILGLVATHPLRAETRQPTQLIIGLIPEINIFNQMQRYEPLARYLSEKTGMPIKLTQFGHYSDILDSFQSKKVDGAFLGSFTAAMAIAQHLANPIARPITLDGESTYFGTLFVRRDSGIRTLDDMKGKRIAFVDKATTAGYVFPLAYLRERGVTDITGFFSEIYFTGSHDVSVLDVFRGQADIGAAKNTVYDRLIQARPEIGHEIEIIATSARVPSNGLCFRPGIPSDLIAKVSSALLEMHTNAEGRDALAKLDSIRFVEAEKDDYYPVLKLAQSAGIAFGEDGVPKIP